MSESEPKKHLPPGIPIKTLRLHQAFEIAGVTGTSIYKNSRSGALETDMVYTPAGVFGYRKAGPNKPDVNFVVPLANVIVAYLDDEPAK